MSSQQLDSRLQQFDSERAGFTPQVPAAEMSDEERVARAKQTFLRRLTAKTALSLDSCIRCGMCAEVCHFNETTKDPRYAPVRKYRLLTRVYRRELSPIRWLNRLFIRDITADNLREWQELVYDSCTDCGRCDMICPMGIPISEAIGLTREGLAEAGMAPDEVRALEREQQDKGTLFGVGADELRQVVGELRNEGIEVPLDKDQAEIMVLTSALNLKLFRESLAATARILNHLGADWTIRSDGFEANHYGYLSGNREAQRMQTRRIADAGKACGAKIVIVPECGHAYMALRWKGANVLGESLPFEVRAISEFIGREIKAGRLRLRRVANGKSVTYHDPCQLGRQGGVFDEPRIALNALGVELREVTETRRTNICCGAGEGVNWIERAAPLREKAFAFKRKEIDATGASSLVTSCDSCRYNFMTGARQTNWSMPIESLVELVAENLDE